VNRTDRLYALVDELRARAPRLVRANDLAKRFEVTTRTIERDLLALQEAGVPIWAQRGPGGGYALNADTSRSLPDTQALALLQALPGIGPFSSELILLRGAGHPDYLTFVEPRFRVAVTHAYRLDHLATDDDLRRISAAWRPYRMSMTFLLRKDAARVASGWTRGTGAGLRSRPGRYRSQHPGTGRT